MFSNIGRKLKTLAMLICWLGIIVSVILGFVTIAQANQVPFLERTLVISGLTTMGVGSLCAWIGALFTYGFGQLIENTDVIRKQLSNEPEEAKEPEAENEPEEQTNGSVAEDGSVE